ncbi:MAG: 50S ribosomal protein L4 [Actinomycetota bacterium]|nr:50S ribosomal protein L4 [Acidimicrobiia bacterium]MDQ3293545.1 50S ribosomal protein L4 [Actinomycetota bacterium]
MSVKVDVKGLDGSAAGSVDLDEKVFGIEPNIPVMHQVVTAQLGAKRAGTQSTLTRSEVRGGGAKPWKQKGTGKGRAGSMRQPNFVGGGVTHAPKPRSYAQKTPKKMVRLALHSALSDRAANGVVFVVDSWALDAPSTKAAVKLLTSLEATAGRTLVVVGAGDEAAWKSFRNLTNVHTLLERELNVYDVLLADRIVFSRATLPTFDKKKAAPSETPVSISSEPAPAAEEGDES